MILQDLQSADTPYDLLAGEGLGNYVNTYVR